MKKLYTVFSSHIKTASVIAMLGAQQVEAIIPALDTQLVPVDPLDGTISLNTTGPEAIAEAEALFTEGATISIEFTAVAVAAADPVAAPTGV